MRCWKLLPLSGGNYIFRFQYQLRRLGISQRNPQSNLVFNLRDCIPSRPRSIRKMCCLRFSSGSTALRTTSFRYLNNSTDESNSYTLQLQQLFSGVSLDEYAFIVTAYNQILPYIYNQPGISRITDYQLRAVFTEGDYLWRTVYILDILDDLTFSTDKEEVEVEKDDMHKLSIKQNDLEEDTMKGFGQIMIWTRPKTIKTFQQHNALLSQFFGQSLVIDCGYENTMIHQREVPSYTFQIMKTILDNTRLREPFHLHICNLGGDSCLNSKEDPGNDSEQTIHDHFVTVTDKCFTEIFNKKDLVLLSPDAPLLLESFDKSKTYVIGGIVDLGEGRPWTYNKARLLDIECRQLPLDVYLEWGAGNNKKLTIPAVLSILNILKETGDWVKALEASISSRCLARNQQLSEAESSKRTFIEERLRRTESYASFCKEIRKIYKSKENSLKNKEGETFSKKQKRFSKEGNSSTEKKQNLLISPNKNSLLHELEQKYFGKK